MARELSCHFQTAWTFCSQRQHTVCLAFTHIQTFIRILYLGSPWGVLNKELNSEPKTKDCNDSSPLCLCVCVGVYIHVVKCPGVCLFFVFFTWKEQTGDCSRLVL